jgi:hypothetical protein
VHINQARAREISYHGAWFGQPFSLELCPAFEKVIQKRKKKKKERKKEQHVLLFLSSTSVTPFLGGIGQCALRVQFPPILVD